MNQNSEAENNFSTTLVLVIGYFLLQVLSNFTVAKQTPLLSNLVIPIGSLLYAITYTWIDLVNDYLGKNKARLLVTTSICANILMILWLTLYIHLPGTKEWYDDPRKQFAISFVFGGYWRIYVASLTTNFICENIDIMIFHYLKYKHSGIPRWMRSLLSNSVSAPLDAFLFAFIAFYGTMPIGTLSLIIVSSMMYKIAIGYLSIPILYAVKSRVVSKPS